MCIEQLCEEKAFPFRCNLPRRGKSEVLGNASQPISFPLTRNRFVLPSLLQLRFPPLSCSCARYRRRAKRVCWCTSVLGYMDGVLSRTQHYKCIYTHRRHFHFPPLFLYSLYECHIDVTMDSDKNEFVLVM